MILNELFLRISEHTMAGWAQKQKWISDITIYMNLANPSVQE